MDWPLAPFAPNSIQRQNEPRSVQPPAYADITPPSFCRTITISIPSGSAGNIVLNLMSDSAKQDLDLTENFMIDPGTPPVIGVIGGSGVYEIDGLTNTEWRQIVSPFGLPSDALLFGELDGQQIVFLPRHGRGHQVPPSGLNFRANIDAMKRAGVTEILSISAVGSLKEEYAPGHFVLVDQFIDRTFARQKTFFEEGCVAHVSLADPVCSRLGDHISGALSDTGIEYTSRRNLHGDGRTAIFHPR